MSSGTPSPQSSLIAVQPKKDLSQIISILAAKLGQYRLFVFDFDNTISQISTCMPKQLSVADVRDISLKSLIDDPDLFHQFVGYIQSLGIPIGIASFGNKEVIMEILNRVYYQANNPFNTNNIITPPDIAQKYSINWPSCYEAPKGFSKNNMLELFAERFNIPQSDRRNIVLIDDSSRNFNAARGIYSPVLITASAGILPMIRTTLSVLSEGQLTLDEIDTFIMSLQYSQMNQTVLPAQFNPLRQTFGLYFPGTLAPSSLPINISLPFQPQLPQVSIGEQIIPWVSFQDFSQRMSDIAQHNYDLITQRILPPGSQNKVLSVIDRFNNAYLVLVKIDPISKQVFPPV